VTFLDHTADVGLEVGAPTLAELFTRSAAGMACLIHGADRAGDARRAPAGGAVAERRIALSADDLPALLRSWLREVLHWHEAEGLALRGAAFAALTEAALEATVTLVPDALEPIREIKGVTLHRLAVERRGQGWAALVIFDV
jgi:SHS2 domain-containing protein